MFLSSEGSLPSGPSFWSGRLPSGSRSEGSLPFWCPVTVTSSLGAVLVYAKSPLLVGTNEYFYNEVYLHTYTTSRSVQGNVLCTESTYLHIDN